jgi:hypothetical protein
MFTQIIMTLALVGQADPDSVVASPERQKALLAAIRAKAASPEGRAPAPRPKVKAPRTMARYSYETTSRSAGYRAHNAQVAREVEAAAMQQRMIMAEQQRQAMMMLPFALENQRQMLNRQSDIERNQILNRALNGNGGIYVPPIQVNPQPALNGNLMPTP